MDRRTSSPWRRALWQPRSRRIIRRSCPMSLQANVIAGLPRVEAVMNYLVPMAERPRNYTFEPPVGVPRSNTEHEPHKVAIHDARPVAGAVSPDAHGFAPV